MASANRYKAILAEVARDLKIEVASELCKHVSALRLSRENLVERLCRGESVPANQMVDLDSALKAHMPHDEGLRIELHYVSGVTGLARCKVCGAENHYEEGTYTPPARPERAAVAAEPTPVPELSTATPEASEPVPAPVVDTKPLIDFAAPRVSNGGYDAFSWSGHPLPTPGGN